MDNVCGADVMPIATLSTIEYSEGELDVIALHLAEVRQACVYWHKAWDMDWATLFVGTPYNRDG